MMTCKKSLWFIFAMLGSIAVPAFLLVGYNFRHTIPKRMPSGLPSNVTAHHNILQYLKIGTKSNISIAIGLGITSKGIYVKDLTNSLSHMPIFRELLPSFCATATVGYRYHFYLAYDVDDKFFNNATKMKLWKERFSNITKLNCLLLGPVACHMIRCNHSSRLAWAQNDAMMAAHKDGRDFFYRVNDDTVMKTKNWTYTFIYELWRMKPPLVGVVGPKHSGGNTYIMTYDFVHRTHIDIFGFYYPRAYPWWYADAWITNVYKPNRSKKITSVRLIHTMSLKTRYSKRGKPNSQVEKSTRFTLERYLKQFGW